MPTSGQTTLGADVSTLAQDVTVFWRPPFDLRGRWSCAVSAKIPYISLDVSADAVTGPSTVDLGALGDGTTGSL